MFTYTAPHLRICLQTDRAGV